MKWSIPIVLSGSAVLAFSISIGGAGAGCTADDCIAFEIPAVTVCKSFANAQDLTTGLPLLSESSLPEGCDCFEQADVDILLEGDVADPAFVLLQSQLDGAARTACLAVAVENELDPIETNCMSANEVLGEIFQSGACQGQLCNFEPVGALASCPEDGTRCDGSQAGSGGAST